VCLWMCRKPIPWQTDKMACTGVQPAGARLPPPIRNLFTQALGLPWCALVQQFYEWSVKLAVRVTSGQAALTTSARVERLLKAGSAAAMETGELAMRCTGLAGRGAEDRPGCGDGTGRSRG
jgi:hypothetical protein